MTNLTSFFPADIRSSPAILTDKDYLSKMLRYPELRDTEKQDVYHYLLTKFELSYFHPELSIINYIRVNSISLSEDQVKVIKFSIILEGKNMGNYLADAKGGVRYDTHEATEKGEEYDPFEEETDDTDFVECGHKFAKVLIIFVLVCGIKSAFTTFGY